MSQLKELKENDMSPADLELIQTYVWFEHECFGKVDPQEFLNFLKREKTRSSMLIFSEYTEEKILDFIKNNILIK